jgi:cobalt-zinc-cadmium efflux system membrane fusion protein
MRRLVVAVFLPLTLAACSSQPPPDTGPASTTTTAGAPAADPGYFTVPPDQLAHLAIAAARTATWSAVVRTNGTVDWDGDHTTEAIPQVSGPISRIVADAGTQVRAGDPLLYVASPDVSSAMASYRKAKNRLDLAQRTLTRSKDLLDHKAIAPRDFESAQADLNDAATDLQTALQTLRIYGVTQAEIADDEAQNVPIRPEQAMRAPLSGTVVQRLVMPGQFIQAGAAPAFVISNTATVWVQGHVNDKDLMSVHVGDQVDERNASFPQTFHGVVSYIGDLIDPATRTTPVRIVTQNPDRLLKKDLFVDLVIHDRTTREVVAVPTTAVLYDEQNQPFVYVQVQPGQFAQRQVALGGQQGDDTEIQSGVKPGEQIVSQGSVFLQFANTYR